LLLPGSWKEAPRTLPSPALYFLRSHNCRWAPAPAQRSVVPRRKLHRAQQLLGQALPLGEQQSVEEQAGDGESPALEGKQQGHWGAAVDRSSPGRVNNKGRAAGTGQGAVRLGSQSVGRGPDQQGPQPGTGAAAALLEPGTPCREARPPLRRGLKRVRAKFRLTRLVLRPCAPFQGKRVTPRVFSSEASRAPRHP